MPTDVNPQGSLSEQGTSTGDASSEQTDWGDTGEQTPEQRAEAIVKQREQEIAAKARQDALSEAGKKASEQSRRAEQLIRNLQGELEETKAQLLAYSQEANAALSAYVAAEELPKVQEQMKLKMTASRAEVQQRSIAQQRRDAIVRATLEEEGIPSDHPGLHPELWLNEPAFRANIASVKQQVQTEKTLADLQAKLDALTGKKPPAAPPQTPPQGTSDGAGVGMVGEALPGGGTDYRRVSKDTWKREYDRRRQATGYNV